ncbi:phosphoprotein phosphatase 1 domain protein [Dictyocaulus viviparus]|uniref:Phosphoprotein phosphatase 1 domain protein n=1 Tax=Dictyocaulus viviparus TaxID=29172 RepID=A0A0D8XRD3_DICVI|nr:phosphoprotein phosphatase 1 domain protein [Dictyocaulus viviparus]
MKYGPGMWWDFQACFNRIPLAGLISKKVLCMHGGLSPELNHLDVIRNIPRPCEPLDRGLLIDLTWSDPTNKGDGWFHSIRGISYMFGKGVVQQACQMLGIDLIIRAHQVVQDGYEMMAGRRLITVFSAPNYCGQFTNAAAIVCLDEDMTISFQQLKMQIPANLANKAKPAPSIACDTNSTNAKADKATIKPFKGFKSKSAAPAAAPSPAPDQSAGGPPSKSTSPAPSIVTPIPSTNVPADSTTGTPTSTEAAATDTTKPAANGNADASKPEEEAAKAAAEQSKGSSTETPKASGTDSQKSNEEAAKGSSAENTKGSNGESNKAAEAGKEQPSESKPPAS